MKSPGPDKGAATGRHPLSALLRGLAHEPGRERISVGDLLDSLGDRALGALLFFFAFPNVLPMPPGTSAVLGAPLIFLAAQLAFGRAPWLPGFVARRSISHADFATLVRRVGPWLERAEKMLRPRLSALVLPPMEYAVGLLCLLLALALVLPIPLGNVLPALAISMLALAILERDGLWMLAGLAVAAAAMVLVSGVAYAMAKATIYLFVNVLL